ncbi:uncharacterized protein LOC109493821 [Felis catus]|uniref:uncharacterized protein LOC109493821 n=1 Tax=Felis catus TaxID=9685 RepID=UPI001D198AE8|nr:uncharacterized protein LOC109493821 [Felis catus]
MPSAASCNPPTVVPEGCEVATDRHSNQKQLQLLCHGRRRNVASTSAEARRPCCLLCSRGSRLRCGEGASETALAPTRRPQSLSLARRRFPPGLRGAPGSRRLHVSVSPHAERAHACPPAPSRRDLGVKRRAGRGSHRCFGRTRNGFQWLERMDDVAAPLPTCTLVYWKNAWEICGGGKASSDSGRNFAKVRSKRAVNKCIITFRCVDFLNLNHL